MCRSRLPHRPSVSSKAGHRAFDCGRCTPSPSSPQMAEMGARLCENTQEPTSRRIVSSIALFPIAATALFVFRLTKSRRIFYAQIERLCFHTASGITRRRQRLSERPLTGQQRSLAFCRLISADRGRKQKFKLRHYPAPRPLHRSRLGLTASRLRRHGGQGGGSR